MSVEEILEELKFLKEKKYKESLFEVERKDNEIKYELTGFKVSDPDFKTELMPNGVDLSIRIITKEAAEEEKQTVVVKIKIKKNEKVVKIKSGTDKINYKIHFKTRRLNHDNRLIRNMLKTIDRIISNYKFEKIKVDEKYNKPDEWTHNQQNLLEISLSKFPSKAFKDEKERWLKIANSVAGKNAQQCFNRYQFIRQQILEKTKNLTLNENPNPIPTETLKVEPHSVVDTEPQPDADENDDTESGYDTDSNDPEFLSTLTVEEFMKLNPDNCSKVHLTGLNMKNISFFEVSNISCLLQCLYCGDIKQKLVINSAQQRTGQQADNLDQYWCENKRCGHTLRYKMKSCLLHENNKTHAAVLESENVVILDIQLLSFNVFCYKCNSKLPISDLERNSSTSTQLTCVKCFEKPFLIYRNLEIEQNRKLSKDTKQASFKKKVRDKRINFGQPLPDTGTCKHYKKSNRWLRFPCCNRAFPCDVCHDMEGHCEGIKRALRHICGYCSYEQPISKSETECKKCKKNIGYIRRTRHWEGGKGCRDKKLMDSRDSKKYKDSKNKTKSNKENRVGPKKKKK